MNHQSGKKFLALLLCIVLAAGPVSAAGTESADPDMQVSPAAESRQMDEMIRSMLQEGEYVEGEAVAVVRSGELSEQFAETEKLSEADAEAVAQAIEKKLGTGCTSAAEAERRFSDKDTYDVILVTDHTQSAEALLKRLYADPDVVSAEPNYIVEQPASFDGENSKERADTEKEEPEEGTAHAAAAEEPADTSGDLTFLQWYTKDDSPDGWAAPEAPQHLRYSMNVPGWNGEDDNASGTIAIMDTGIDTSHPDLKDVLFEFSEEQQEKYACGPYGKNVNNRQISDDEEPAAVPDEEYQRDITDHGMHGTHVAGIIAAAWNGNGISGITKGTKIFCVRVFSDDGSSQSSTDIVRGYEWLLSVAKEVNLKAVNVSLGTLKSQLIHTIMVNRLGEQGVNTVIASGNLSSDMDETIDLGGENNSPFEITVNAADLDGKLPPFSCYGKMSTDVFAPGAQILSSVPGNMTMLNNMGQRTDVKKYLYFFPETTDPSHLAFDRIEKFDSDKPSVRFFDACPVNEDGSENTAAKEVGSLNNEYGFDDGHSYAIPAEPLPDPEKTDLADRYPAAHSFWMAVPAENVDDVRWISGKAAYNDGSHAYCGVASVLCARKNDDGTLSPANIDMQYDNALSGFQPEDKNAPAGGLSTAAGKSLSSSQWTLWSLDLKGFVEEAAYFHKVYNDWDDITDPGDITGVYRWEDDGTAYILVQLATQKPEDSRSPFEGDDTLYLMDDIAAGDDEASVGAYFYECGTSMAAPCVTAALAVIARDEPASSSLSDEELKEEALERAAKLLASVDYDEDLEAYCRTGGRVDLKDQTEFTKKAPLITEARTDGDTLTIKGYFFGEKGTLTIDGEAASPSSWSENEITVSVEGLKNGSHEAKIVNPDNAVMSILFSASGLAAEEEDGAENADSKALPLYDRTLSLPLEEPGFAEDLTDGFYGSMAALDGSLYVLTCDNDQFVEGMWRYDISSDQWTHCAKLPDDLNKMTVEYDSLAVSDGKVYLYMYRKGLNIGTPQLWRYTPGSDSWDKLEINGLRINGQLTSLDGRLLFIAELPFDEDAESKASVFNFIDTEKGELIRAEGSLPEKIGEIGECRFAAAGSLLYAIGSYDNDEEERMEISLYRFTYDEEKNAFVSENLTEAVTGILENRFNCACVGTPDGLVIISPKEAGKDTYFVKNDGKDAVLMDHTSCYHTTFSPVAGYDDGSLFVLAMNATEPDVLYFRSVPIS